MTAPKSDPGNAGEERWPPGFRFHPTDEELVAYYLKRKMCRRSLKLDVITDTDVYKWDPDELPGQSILKTGDRQWFFFSPRERKYPNAGRSNRATTHGYWKATGKDRNVTCNSRTVGIKKTLVFYRGRAPNGDRTDWVMHEYTLDEEELKRCANVKDYYALYKVYKKSGPGPKNGEQYGAPFKEEEWADEEDHITNNKMVVSEVREKQVDVAPAHDLQVIAQGQPTADDIDEFMKRILDDPLLPQQQITDFANFLQAVGEDDSQITLVDPSSGHITVPHSTISTATNGGRYNEQVNFGLAQLGPSNPQVFETPEVTSVTSNWDQAPHLVAEEGFLEIDDLDKELGSSFEQKPVDNLQLFEDFDDLFQDAAMYLHGTGPINHGAVAQSFNIENGTVNQPNYHMQSNSFTNQEQYQLPVASQADYQFHANSTAVNQQIWAVEQNNTFTPSQSCQPAVSVPSSGVASESVNLHPEGNQNNNNINNRGEDGAESSWMSSMLWSFVESIPTTPASASESPLVNRAFERMSSFSRLRLNPRNDDIIAADNNGPPTVSRITVNNNNKKGFLLVSIIGALVAVLWVFFSTVRIIGRCVFS